MKCTNCGSDVLVKYADYFKTVFCSKKCQDEYSVKVEFD